MVIFVALVQSKFGIIRSLHNKTQQFRLVTKTALKLLVVFVEYGEVNCAKFLAATKKIDEDKGHKLFYNIMRVLDEQVTFSLSFLI